VLSKTWRQAVVIAAKAGTKVEGQITSTAAPSASGAVDSMHLRWKTYTSRSRDGSSAEKHAAESGTGVPGISLVEDTGRIALVLYVAGM